ncbi:MAG: ArsR/SmtB family transcription factor [Haloferacaceae archaeon]
MGDKEWSPSNVFELFGDELARQILVLTSERPLAADELAEHLEVSPPTVYRRTNALVEQDLVRERQQVDADGHHYRTFETTLKRVAFEIEDGGYNVDVEMRRSLADQFQALWTDLERASPDGDRDATDDAEPEATADDLPPG